MTGPEKPAGLNGQPMVNGPWSGSRLHVLYLFAGPGQRLSLKSTLDELRSWDAFAEFPEPGVLDLDVLSQPLHPDRRLELIQSVGAGEFHVVVLSPPANSHARAAWANGKGPGPLRSSQHPLGFPWLAPPLKEQAEASNSAITLCLSVAEAAVKAFKRGLPVRCLLDFPEDLGAVRPGVVPASLWQLSESRGLLKNEFMATAALKNSWFLEGLERPLRVLGNLVDVAALQAQGLPKFNPDESYKGPLLLTPKSNSNLLDHADSDNVHPEPLSRFLSFMMLGDWAVSHLSDLIPTLSTEPPRLRHHGTSELMQRGDVWIGNPNSVCRAQRSFWFHLFSSDGSSSSAETFDQYRHFIFRSRFLQMRLGALANVTLWCDCSGGETCHGHAIIQAFQAGAHLQPQRNAALVGRGSLPQAKLRKLQQVLEVQEIGPVDLQEGPAAGSGWRGTGAPIQVTFKGVNRDLHDGAGLCSPGRWIPKHRQLPQGVFPALLQRMIGILQKLQSRWDSKKSPLSIKNLIIYIAAGKCSKLPFPADLVTEARAQFETLLRAEGWNPERREGDAPSYVRVRLLQAILQAANDPDAVICEHAAGGVRVGVGTTLPRVPAVFEQKQSWALEHIPDEVLGQSRSNYSSARDRPEVLEKQFQDEIAENFMIKVTFRDAKAKYGNDLLLAALGALEKKLGSNKWRVIFDATHGVLVNFKIKVRDRLRFPAVQDLMAVVSEIAQEADFHFALYFDVHAAHRLLPVKECDWGFQACTLVDLADIQDDSPVYLNTVGTFGVASAAYWWQRLGSAIMRALHYILQHDHALFALLFADDGFLTGRGRAAFPALLLSLLFFAVIGLPLSWDKLRGGFQGDWIGYYVDIVQYQVGLSESRALWVVRWCTATLGQPTVLVKDLRDALGRLSFAAGPLVALRPFLGPLYAWTAACPANASMPLPAMIRLILYWISFMLGRRRVRLCRQPAPMSHGELFRVDAKAEGLKVCVAGWSLLHGSDTFSASWFSMELDSTSAPWAFENGQPFRKIASLELLAVLLGVIFLLPPADFDPGRHATAWASLCLAAAGTDNQSNELLIDRMMTTKFPLCAILMELSTQLEQRGIGLALRWRPRELNTEADALTNGDFSLFSDNLRVPASMAAVPWVLLPDLLEKGQAFLDELRLERAAKRARPDGEAARKKPKVQSLKTTDPW